MSKRLGCELVADCEGFLLAGMAEHIEQ